MTWRRWVTREADVAERESTPELDQVRRLARIAIELGRQVDQELQRPTTEGPQRDD